MSDGPTQFGGQQPPQFPGGAPAAPPPPPPAVKKPWFKKWWIWAIVVVALIIIGSAAGGGGNDSAAPAPGSSVAPGTHKSTASDQQSQEAPANDQPKTPGVGTPVTVDDVTVTLKSYAAVTKLSSPLGNKKGYWMSVKVTVANKSKEAITIDNSSFTLVEPDGTEYETDSDALMYIDHNDSFFLAKINPKQSKTGELLFAIPKSAKSLKLHFKPSMFGGTAEIELRK